MSDALKKALRKIVKPGGFDEPVVRAVVLSVDKTGITCSVKTVADNLQINGVKLKPVINNNDTTKMGLVVFPAVGSFVLVGQVADNNIDVFVVSCTQIESISLDNGPHLTLQIGADGKINLNSDLITFNGGHLGGIPKLIPLTDAVNNLQAQINTLLDAFNSHTHTVSSGLTGLPLPPLIPLSHGVNINSSDIENKSIVQ
jgi:hypothetical protein